MTLQKRDCPIKIRAYPTGSQFSRVEFDIHADRFSFAPSAALGCRFGDFVKALYALYYEEYDPHDEWNRCHSESGKSRGIEAMVSEVEWDNEGELLYITMRRSWLPDADDIIELKMETELVNPPFQKNIPRRGARPLLRRGKMLHGASQKVRCLWIPYGDGGGSAAPSSGAVFESHGLQVQEPRTLRAVDPFVMGTDFEKEMELLQFDM